MSDDTQIHTYLPNEYARCEKCGERAKRIALLFKKRGLRCDHYYCTVCQRHFDVTRIDAALVKGA